MTIFRRDLFGMGIAAGAALSFPSVLRAQTAPTKGGTVRMVFDGLAGFDPVFSTSNSAQNHALAIYDSLFALDSKLMPQPQMVGKWGVSDDKKTYTFRLRDGLSFHDGSPVTAADCVASIRRWAQTRPGGKLMLARLRDISKKDDKTFTIALKEPLGLLIDILVDTSLFVMREKDASRPANEQVTANIGSGPFTFNQALAKPGVSFAYDRNQKYVARNEPANGLAGGKVVKVDRVFREIVPDPQIAVAALQAGEVDYMEGPPPDLYPAIGSDPNLVLQVLNKSGDVYYLRTNFLQKPFDNVKMRQALLHVINQEAFLRVLSPDPRYGEVVTSIFGNNTPYSNDENTGWYKKGGNPEKAKQLLKEAGYAGEKVVILQSTNWQQASNAAQLLASTLRKIGVDAELAPSDWAGVVARMGNKGSVENGGWSIVITSYDNYGIGNPIGSLFLQANGDPFAGWLKNDEFEALRAKWPDVDTLEERKALARKMQKHWWDFVGAVMLGKVVQPIAHRKTLTGLISVPSETRTPMWNMQKV